MLYCTMMPGYDFLKGSGIVNGNKEVVTLSLKFWVVGNLLEIFLSENLYDLDL